MKREVKLQSEIVAAHSQKHPKQWGQLFHVSNERNHKLQAFQAAAIGIVNGVSDLIYISKKFNVAMELKVSGRRHDVSKIRNQIRWGKIWVKMSKNNHWRMVFTVDQASACCEGKFKGYTLKQASRLVKNVKTKTIKILWVKDF